MSDAAQTAPPDADQGQDPSAAVPQIRVKSTQRHLDPATLLGIVFALGFIIAAIYLGQSNANFFNVPALLLVLFGTIAATAISFTPSELGKAGSVIGRTILRPEYDHSAMAKTLLDLAVVARKHGVLALSSYDTELRKNTDLHYIMQMVIDGYQPADIQHLISQENDALVERHKRSATITRRAAEVAPAMGLIGTLVGLVQMLADLENPEAIGPAMAVALLTTFYGAILGTVVMGPLSIKLEKTSFDESLSKTMMMTAAVSIAGQENPRRLEMLLNSELPPSQRITYFE